MWHIWKACNAVRFDSASFYVEQIIFGVMFDLRLAGLAFIFKPTQLRGIMDTQLEVGVRVIIPLIKLAKFISWLRPPYGVVKRSVDGALVAT